MRALSSPLSSRAESTRLVLVAALIGLFGAVGGIVFQSAIRLATRGFALLGEGLGRTGPRTAALVPALVLAAGAVALLGLERLFPGHALGYGFPRFLEMVHLEGARVKRRWMIVKTLGSAIALGAGASVGREGPIAQIGGSIGSAIARILHTPAKHMRLLVACGAAAGIATTFNAPIGSVMFAQEIVLQGRVELAHFSLVIVSAATAVVAARASGAVETVFHARPFVLAGYHELASYALMGVLLGLLAAAYVRLFHGALACAERTRLGTASKLVIGLTLVGLVGTALPRNLSDGYPTIDAALAGQLAWPAMATLAVAKILTSVLSLASGAPGGVFGPIFFIGAMTGGTFRALFEALFPGFTGPRGSYALVGLSALLAACTHAPLTALFLLFETTGTYQVALPALVTVGLAVVVASSIEAESIDTLGLTRAGKSLTPPREQIMDLIPVEAAFHDDFRSVPARASLVDLLRIVSESSGSAFPVLDAGGRLLGTISLHDVRPLLLDLGAGEAVIAADLCDPHTPTVTPATSLGQALRRMESDRREEIPVVDPADPGHVVGMLSRGDVIRAYNRSLLGLRMMGDAAGGAAPPLWSRGYRVISLAVPPTWSGRTLRELDCRARLGVNVLAVEQGDLPGHRFEIPDPDRPLVPGDTLVVAGPAAAVSRLESMPPGSWSSGGNQT